MHLVILRCDTKMFKSQITYYNIVLRENQQNLQRVSQNLRPFLDNFIFIADGKNSGDNLLQAKTNFAVLF